MTTYAYLRIATAARPRAVADQVSAALRIVLSPMQTELGAVEPVSPLLCAQCGDLLTADTVAIGAGRRLYCRDCLAADAAADGGDQLTPEQLKRDNPAGMF